MRKRIDVIDGRDQFSLIRKDSGCYKILPNAREDVSELMWAMYLSNLPGDAMVVGENSAWGDGSLLVLP